MIDFFKRGADMWFLKSKQYEGILPPPPPHAIIDEENKTESLKEIEKSTELRKEVTKKEKITSKKKLIAKKVKVKKKELKRSAYGRQIKKSNKPNRIKPLVLVKELKLEDFDINIEKELMQETKAKPKEVIEAEEEIKSAIDKIKEKEKNFFFKKFFPIKQRSIEKPMKETFVHALPELDKTSMIQNKINEAKQALMKFDLESAKRSYIDILKMYNDIKPEEQARVYQDIRDLYFERKGAEELI